MLQRRVPRQSVIHTEYLEFFPGLLAGLWEFPSLSVELDMSQKTCTTKAVDCLDKYLEKHAVGSWDVKFVEEVGEQMGWTPQRSSIFGRGDCWPRFS